MRAIPSPPRPRLPFLRLACALLLLLTLARPAPALPGEEWGTPENDVVAIPATRPPDTPGNRASGKRIYTVKCAFCHGEKGDGKGPVAEYLEPRPRDFTAGKFKLRSTDSQTLPTDEDLYRTITRGIPASAMPSWREPYLTADERWLVAYYVKGFNADFDDPDLKPYVKPLPVGAEPAATPALLAQGKALYERQKCWECHGRNGRGNGVNSLKIVDDWKVPIHPGDMTQPWTFKGGPSVRSIYQRFTTGMTGTPMPSYAAQMSDAERWALSHYIASLAREYEEHRAPSDALVTAQWTAGVVPRDPAAPEWDTCERLDVSLAGQILFAPRHWKPANDLASVRAIWSAEEVAVLVSWHDRGNETRQKPPDAWADAVAVQFAAAPVVGPEKPHFLNGDARHAVTLWHWNAAWEAGTAADAPGHAPVEEEVGRGLARIEPARLEKPEAERVRVRSSFLDGEWRVVFVRRRVTGPADQEVQFPATTPIPFAINLWDGFAGEHDGAKAISSWRYLLLYRPTPVSAYAAAVGAGLAAAAVLGLAYAAWLRAGRRPASAPVPPPSSAPRTVPDLG